MKGITAALWSESLKVRRSRIFLVTILVAIFIPVMMGFMMLIIKHPELASKARMLAIKASMIGKASWLTFFNYLSMTVTAGGLVIFGFVASWIFGREYSDRTVKDLLALPIPRPRIVQAKFLVMTAWCLLLALIIFTAGLAVGGIVGLDGWSGKIVLPTFGTFIGCAFLTIVVCTPVAFFASFSRGYLFPIGFVILTLVFIQVSNFAGYTQYIPWAVPMLIAGASGGGSEHPGAASYIILILTSFAGLTATMAWWRYADQT
jgi:ABC-2 type transport system permease protein